MYLTFILLYYYQAITLGPILYSALLFSYSAREL